MSKATKAKFSVRNWLRDFQNDANWKAWTVGNITHVVVIDLLIHEVHIQQRLDNLDVIDLTFRHPEECSCREAMGAPAIQPPLPL